MLLVFDVGNTNMVLGLYEDKELIKYWRINTDKNKTSDEYGILINNLFQYEKIDLDCIEDVIISSVVPDVMHSLENFSKKYCKKQPKVVGPGIKTGLNIKYDNPKQVGADRIVNAVSCVEKYGAPVIVVDFGTATTFCATRTLLQAEQCLPSVRPVFSQSASTALSITSVWPFAAITVCFTRTLLHTEQCLPSVRPVFSQSASTASSITSV